MKKSTLLIIGLVWPEPNSSAAGTRILQLVEVFKNQGYDIFFVSAAQEGEYSFHFENSGVKTQKIILNHSSFNVFVSNLNPAIVLFDRFVTEEHFGWRVQESCPDAVRILDTEDLHCLRLTRQNAFKQNKAFNTTDLLTEAISKREIASILRCDISLIVSTFEMTILNSIFKVEERLLYYLPIFYENEKQESLLDFSQKKDFVFIGNFLHEPNWDAVKQLKQHIWNSIHKQLPESSLHIYGAYVPQKAIQLQNSKDKFYVHGRAENAAEVISHAKILLAPLQFGAGIKGKLLESMKYGTPSITTSIGSEGISDNNFWNGFVADDTSTFIENAILLYQNATIWQKSRENGFTIIQNTFDKNLYVQSFIDTINNLQTDLKEHRKYNFMGSLLQENQFLSTKYLSKWIEEKNS